MYFKIYAIDFTYNLYIILFNTTIGITVLYIYIHLHNRKSVIYDLIIVNIVPVFFASCSDCMLLCNQQNDLNMIEKKQKKPIYVLFFSFFLDYVPLYIYLYINMFSLFPCLLFSFFFSLEIGTQTTLSVTYIYIYTYLYTGWTVKLVKSDCKH